MNEATLSFFNTSVSVISLVAMSVAAVALIVLGQVYPSPENLALLLWAHAGLLPGVLFVYCNRRADKALPRGLAVLATAVVGMAALWFYWTQLGQLWAILLPLGILLCFYILWALISVIFIVLGPGF